MFKYKFHSITYTLTCHTDPGRGTAHALHSFSLSMHLNMHYTPSTTHSTAFHNPPMHTTNTRHSWQNGTRCRDGVKVLWCHSHLVWLRVPSLHALVFIPKMFCDLCKLALIIVGKAKVVLLPPLPKQLAVTCSKGWK